MDNTFIVIWTPTKLIGVVDVSGYDKKQMWHVLKGNEPISLIRFLRPGIISLQATKDEYEIYSVTAVEGTTAKDITLMFNEDPLHGAELIRSRGRNLNTQKKELV